MGAVSLPTPFITVGGTELALPPGALRERAYVMRDVQAAPPVGAVDAISYTVPGDLYVVPLSVFANYGTDAQAGDRVVALELQDEDGNDIWYIPASVVQTAAQSYAYTWSVGAGVTFTGGVVSPSTIAYQVGMIPATVMLPGFTFSLTCPRSVGPNDLFQNVAWAALAIPSGTHATRLTLTPTPKLV